MCERELAARTSIEQDQAILKTPRFLSDAAVLAIRFRIEKKQILSALPEALPEHEYNEKRSFCCC